SGLAVVADAFVVPHAAADSAAMAIARPDERATSAGGVRITSAILRRRQFKPDFKIRNRALDVLVPVRRTGRNQHDIALLNVPAFAALNRRRLTVSHDLAAGDKRSGPVEDLMNLAAELVCAAALRLGALHDVCLVFVAATERGIEEHRLRRG